MKYVPVLFKGGMLLALGCAVAGHGFLRFGDTGRAGAFAVTGTLCLLVSAGSAFLGVVAGAVRRHRASR